MVLSSAQSVLLLGSSSLALSNTISDCSYLFEVSSSFHYSSNWNPFVTSRLLEEREEQIRVKIREKQVEDEVVGSMGHIFCSKRQIKDQLFRFLNPLKRIATDMGMEPRRSLVKNWGNQVLEVADPKIHEIIEKERQRQCTGIELIALENFMCRAVMEALGSHMTNKYSKGMLGVQPYSCTFVNFAVFIGLLYPSDRIMGLNSSSGGHLSHGYYTQSGKKVVASSIFLESLPYKVNP